MFFLALQLCGVRGGGNAAPQALFWQVKSGVSFVLAFESDRERNAAIMLARRYAYDCNVSTCYTNFEDQNYPTPISIVYFLTLVFIHLCC